MAWENGMGGELVLFPLFFGSFRRSEPLPTRGARRPGRLFLLLGLSSPGLGVGLGDFLGAGLSGRFGAGAAEVGGDEVSQDLSAVAAVEGAEGFPVGVVDADGSVGDLSGGGPAAPVLPWFCHCLLLLSCFCQTKTLVNPFPSPRLHAFFLAYQHVRYHKDT